MNRKQFILIIFFSILIFRGHSQADKEAEIRASINQTRMEIGYVELEPTFPPPIGHATLACMYEYTTTTPVDKTLPYVRETEVLSEKKEIVEKYQTILFANSSNSIFRDYHLYLKDSILYYNTSKLSTDSLVNLDRQYRNNVEHQFIPAIVKNYPEHKMSVLDEVAPNSYNYEEDQTGLNLILMEDTLTVCGYVCHQAKAYYGGREWIVWYTPEIPLSDGPWKLYGLPGLILKATDMSGIHSFEATSIRESNFPVYLKPHPLSFSVKRKDFLVLKRRLESADKPMWTPPQNSYQMFGGIGHNRGTLNERRVLINRVCVYEPLELE